MADVSQIVLQDANGNVIGTYNVKDTSVPHDSKSAASGGTTLSLVTTGEKATWNAKSDTNTTYTFANGTNGFTVTPSGGTAQTVTVTPSIPYIVTGSGTEGYIAKFSTERTITNGPAFGSSTSTYLRNDGNWATPTNNAVTQTNTTGTNASYRVLLSATNDDTTRTEGARKNGDLYYNPSTNSLHSTKFNGYTLGAACAYSATTSVTSGSGALVTSGAVYTGLSGKQNTLSTSDVSSSLSVSGNLQSVTKKLFKYGNVVELFMTGNVKTAIADNGIFLTVPSGYNPKVNDSGFTFFTGSDQYIPTGFRFGYFTWGGRDFHTLGALGVGTQVTVHITYLI